MSGSRQYAVSARSKIIAPHTGSIDDRWNDLMVAAQGGDDRAYERLVGELHGWFSRYFRKRLPWAAAQDATQEALLTFHAYMPRYATDAPMKPWLRAIARFKWLDQLRIDSRRPHALCEVEAPVGDHGQASRAAILLERLLSEVKPSQAQVIRLVKPSGASVADASIVAGQSPALVKVNIHRALKRISELVSD